MAQAVEAWWWRRYLGGRDPVAYLHWKRRYWRDFLARVGVSVRPEARVLDAGCGPAGVFSVLSHARVTALDPLLAAYRTLPHFDPGAYPDVRFRDEPLEGFVADTEYDYVFCLNAINHVLDLDAAAQALASALAEDGLAVVSVDAHRHAPLRRVFAAIPGDVLHPHQLDEAGYVLALERAGLEVVDRVLINRAALFDYVALVCFRKTGQR